MKKNKRNGLPISEAFKPGRAKARLYGSSTPVMKNDKRSGVPISEAFKAGRAKARLYGSSTPNMKNNKGNGVPISKGFKVGRAKARLYGSSTPIMKNNKGNGVPISKGFKAGRAKARLYSSSTPIMKNKELDAKSLWIQVEDVLVPRLGLSVIDHVVYTHLLRHSRLEGKRRLRFSIPWLARNIHLSTCPTREAVRRLAAQGALRLVERSKQGHVVEVRLPEEIRGVRAKTNRAHDAAQSSGADDIEDVDFLKNLELRRAIHAREGGKCFYCLRQVPARLACLDHVVPRAKVRCNSYRNLVSCCMECNSEKGERPAGEFLRWLFRERQLGAADLKGRFRALELLAAGKLRPKLPSQGEQRGQEKLG